MKSNLFNPASITSMLDKLESQEDGACDTTGSLSIYRKAVSVTAEADLDLITITQTYGAGAIAVAYAHLLVFANEVSTLKLRLYMDGVQVEESDYLASTIKFYTLKGSKALTGSKIVKLSLHNYNVADKGCNIVGQAAASSHYAAGLFAGSVRAS